MCGFAVLVGPGATRRGAHTLMDRLIRPLATRGPDAQEIWIDPEAGFAAAHRRLSVLDLAGGAQPMHSRDGRWVLAYNGEVYNHEELAARLRRGGHDPIDRSDTRILLEAIAAWGLETALESADGMWAFSLWDRRERVLHLSRDRLGEKPLVYGRVGADFVAASTLAPLRAHPDATGELDPDALALYLRYKCVPHPYGILTGTAKVPPATTISWSATGGRVAEISRRRYWDLEKVWAEGAADPWELSPTEAVDRADELISTSVGRRLVADRPVGAFLSGGVDSRTIAAAAVGHRRDLATFTIGSPDPRVDESALAAATARTLGTDHHELIVGSDDALAAVGSLVSLQDEPLGDSSLLPSALVSALAASTVVAALSGDGGDELFGGYTRYGWVPSLLGAAGHLPTPIGRSSGRLLARVPQRGWDTLGRALPAGRRPRHLGMKVHKAAQVLIAGPGALGEQRSLMHWPDSHHMVRGVSEALRTALDGGLPVPGVGWTGVPPLDHGPTRMAVRDLSGYLPDDILTKVDRAAMGVSLETRAPFLSRDLVEFAARLPPELRRRDGQSKWVLRQVLGRSLPEELVGGAKTGFGVPLGPWLRGPLRGWATELLRRPVAAVDEVVDPRPVERAWRIHQRGTHDLSAELWDVLMLRSWCDAGLTPR